MKTIVIIGSGPSLTDDQCAYVAEKRKAGLCKITTVNRSFQKLECDYIVAADAGPWEQYIDEMVEISPNAELWCHHKVAIEKYQDSHGLKHFECVNNHKGLIKEPPKVSGGANSGHMAINLAYQWGYKNIALLGFDFQHTGGRAHWFGNHEVKSWANAHNVERWIELMEPMAKDLAKENINIWNCTTETAIESLPKCNISDFFNRLL